MKFGKIKKAATSFLEKYKTNDPVVYAAAQQAVGGLLILDAFIGIENPLDGRKRSGIFGALIGIIVGTVFLFVPTIFNAVSGVNQLTTTATATVVSISKNQITNTNGSTSTSCNAVASYTIKGTLYHQPSSIESSSMCSMTIGSSITIKYNPNNPAAWGYNVDSLNFYLKIFAVMGGLVILTSLVTFVIRLLSIIFGWKLIKSGRALAKTLPGTNLGTLINEIKKDFANHVFGFGQPGVLLPLPLQPLQPPPPLQPPIQPQPPFAPTQPTNQQMQSPLATPPTPIPSSETKNPKSTLM